MRLLSLLLCPIVASTVLAEPQGELSFTIERTVAHSGFDGNDVLGACASGSDSRGPTGKRLAETARRDDDAKAAAEWFGCLLCTQRDSLVGPGQVVDRAAAARVVCATDRWIGFRAKLPTGASIAPQLLQAGDETTVCDFTPQWHAASQRLLGLGHTVWYRDNRVMHVRPRGIAYAVYDAPAKQWAAWNTVDLPAEPKFQCAGSGSVQRVDLPGGDVLIPIYFKEPTQTQYSVTVCRCRFDGRTLDYVEHGNELTVPIKRGLYEPSLTQFQGRYYLTMRNDDHGYVSVSDDGLHFAPQRRWTFDDGSDLGNYNTQQHWVTHSDGLFLVYTRRGANNDHVFRHRAPLFIARVDPDKLHVIRETEQILVPERGARLGNFGVVDVSPDETWVTVTEWMQPAGVEKYGSDNSVFVAKLKWNRPNQAVAHCESCGHDQTVLLTSAGLAGKVWQLQVAARVR